MVKSLFYKKVMRRQISDLISDLGDVDLHGGADGLLKGVDMDGDNALDAGELELMHRARCFLTPPFLCNVCTISGRVWYLG